MSPDTDQERETRKSFTALLDLQFPGKNTVMPHGDTREDPSHLRMQREGVELWASACILVPLGKEWERQRGQS